MAPRSKTSALEGEIVITIVGAAGSVPRATASVYATSCTSHGVRVTRGTCVRECGKGGWLVGKPTGAGRMAATVTGRTVMPHPERLGRGFPLVSSLLQ